MFFINVVCPSGLNVVNAKSDNIKYAHSITIKEIWIAVLNMHAFYAGYVRVPSM